MPKMVKLVLIALAAAAVTSFAGCSQESEPADLSTVTDTTFCKGVEICGIDMEGKTKEEALTLLSAVQQKAEPVSIKLTMGDDVYTYTEADFQIDSDYEAAVNDAYEYLYRGSAQDYYSKKYLLSQESKSWNVSQSINEQSLSDQINALVKKLNKKPVEPKVVSHKGGKFTFDDGEKGITVDGKKLLADVQAALEDSNDVAVKISYKETKPSKTKKDYESAMGKLGTFSTVSTNNESGNHNMKKAFSYINGLTLSPGETFSFNDVVGDRSDPARGFEKAGVIIDGRIQDDYGGGICQASTTLYGAVIRSDLEIVERHNHLWPSVYVPIGLDASVNYGTMDFQFRNNTEYPIYIECSMEDTKLSATIYGCQPDDWDTIEISSEQTGTQSPPSATYEEDSSLEKGQIETKRVAREGKTATAKQTFYKKDKVVKTKDLPSSDYSPVGAIYLYGPGTDIS